MDGISAPRGGQLRSSQAVADGVSAPINLIHRNKSGGFGVAPDAERVCVDPRISADDSRPEAGSASFEHLESLPGRLERYARQTGDAVLFGRWLARQKASRREKRVGGCVAGCGSWLMFHDYAQVQRVKLASANFCGTHLLCPFCCGRRASRNLQIAVPKVRQLLRARPSELTPYLLTVTIRDESHCRSMFLHLSRAWGQVVALRREARSRKRSHNIWAELDGGVMSFETKRGSGSGQWHVHGHGVVLGPQGLSSKEIQSAWSDVVGYWAQADLRELRSAWLLRNEPGAADAEQFLAEDLMEVFKYSLKFNAMTFDDRLSAFRALGGQRMVRAFGSLFGLKLDSELADDVSEFEGLPYRELVFRAIGSPQERSYQFVRASSVLPGAESRVEFDDEEVSSSIEGDYL